MILYCYELSKHNETGTISFIEKEVEVRETELTYITIDPKELIANGVSQVKKTDENTIFVDVETMSLFSTKPLKKYFLGMAIDLEKVQIKTLNTMLENKEKILTQIENLYSEVTR